MDLAFTEVIAAEKVPVNLVLLRGQRLGCGVFGALFFSGCGCPLVLFGDAAAAERDRRRLQTVEVVDVCNSGRQFRI